MKLTEKWSIEKDGIGFALVEKKVVNVTVKGKVTGETRDGFNKYFYGTVYQALQGFVQKSGESGKTVSEVEMKAIQAYQTIIELKDKIRQEFRTEVKVVKP